MRHRYGASCSKRRTVCCRSRADQPRRGPGVGRSRTTARVDAIAPSSCLLQLEPRAQLDDGIDTNLCVGQGGAEVGDAAPERELAVERGPGDEHPPVTMGAVEQRAVERVGVPPPRHVPEAETAQVRGREYLEPRVLAGQALDLPRHGDVAPPQLAVALDAPRLHAGPPPEPPELPRE